LYISCRFGCEIEDDMTGSVNDKAAGGDVGLVATDAKGCGDGCGFELGCIERSEGDFPARSDR
jgi:hypothetical protein